MQEQPRWTWERTDPRRSGSSGDLAKLFRHEESKKPGILAKEAPPDAATLLAREVIQNSWDAARELSKQVSNPPQFHIQFAFKKLVGDRKAEIVAALDLASLAERVPRVERQRIGLRESDCLDHLADPGAPLGILEISESGATGMYGPWRQAKSHMYLALVSLGYTEKLSGAGGSYGYGKAGLISGSRVRSVCAYTAFLERDDEPAVTRRLLGMTYWGQHELHGESYTGFARLGAADEEDPESVVPFTNDQADTVAGLLGLPPRDPAKHGDLGTTFLLVDPTISPLDLVQAIERNWWPALVDNEFVATVVDYDGQEHHPRPRRDAVLRTFIDAWEIVTGRSDTRPNADWRAAINGALPTENGRGTNRTLGLLGLVTDLTDWSYADQKANSDEDGISHRSLIALIRGPKMVVEYFEAGHSPPYVRGAFFADEAVNDVLLQTEPKAHDAWRTKDDDGDMAPEVAAVADTILRKIKSTVNNHRQRLKPPTPKADDVNLPYFNEVMRRVLSGEGRGVIKPTPDVRPISIHLDYEPQAVADKYITLKGSARFSLTDHCEHDEALVELSILYRFLEEDRAGTAATLSIQPDQRQDFTEIRPGVFRGLLRRAGEARFSFVSEPYDLDWSGRLIVNGELVQTESEGSAVE